MASENWRNSPAHEATGIGALGEPCFESAGSLSLAAAAAARCEVVRGIRSAGLCTRSVGLAVQEPRTCFASSRTLSRGSCTKAHCSPRRASGRGCGEGSNGVGACEVVSAPQKKLVGGSHN